MARRKSVARRINTIRRISAKKCKSKNFLERAADKCLVDLQNNFPEIMESLASKLRSGKHLHDTSKPNISKDASKRLAETIPDGGTKKRILGDITNRALAAKGKSDQILAAKEKLDPQKNQRLKSENSSNVDSENVKRSISLRSQSSKSSSSADSTMYVTAMEIIDTITDLSYKQEDTKNVTSSPCQPEDVEDYDDTNKEDPNNVSQYAGYIFRWYREREKQFCIQKYLDTQKEMTKSMRAILVDWMVEVQESFELNHETLYLAVKLVDMYLMKNYVAKSKLQLVGATAVFIAAKFDERLPPLIDDFLYICDDSYNRPEFLETEIKILKAVNFDLGIPLSYRFLRRYARCARISMDMLTLARFILETSLMDYELIDVLDSKLAAAALLLALKMKDMEWTSTLLYYTEYQESELQDLIVHLNRNISVPPNKHLQTIRMKYSHEIFFHVAKIPPLKLSRNGLLVKAR